MHRVDVPDDPTYVQDGDEPLDTWVRDGDQPLDVPAGWQIADGSADDARVCGAHPWQSRCLVFANGDAYGTAAHPNPPNRGNAQFALQ